MVETMVGQHGFWARLVTDPSTGDFSASRFSLLVLILDLQILIAMEYLLHRPFSAWVQLALIFGSVCGVYGLNTGLRVWRGRVIKGDK
jgi:hypothetical protein